jgi:AcrR family transcriptional regulator
MTRRSSTRAQAQEFYGQMVRDADDQASRTKETPTLTLPLSGGGKESVASGGGETTTDLTARARALYEGSAVPVREIARLAGVSERTLYKYVEKHGWKKRYARVPRGLAAAQANRGQGWQATAGFAPVKGAGGRFVRREDIGKPFAAGMKALDPAGHARADAACSHAQQRARRAEADAQAERWADENVRAIRAVVRARDDLAAHDAARGNKPARSPRDRLRERALVMSLKVALAWMETTIGAWERAVLASLSPAP